MMEWIAYDPDVYNPLLCREQFNGKAPAWGEPWDDFHAKQGIDVPQVGDELMLRMGTRIVQSRRLNQPETADDGSRVTGWYWTIFVK